MDLTIILTIGKYAIIVALYAFVLVVFRGIISQLAAESRRAREVSYAAPARRVRSPRVAPRPQPPAQPKAERPSPEPPPEPAQTPAAEPVVAAAPAPPPRRASRIDLLGEARGPVEVSAVSPSEPAPSEPVIAEPPAPRQATAPHLLVIESDDDRLEAGKTIGLSAAVTIGRSEENSLQVTDRFISSRHALVCLRDGRRILVDRGSTNGTFVNGERVEGEVELADGDRVALGNTVLEYHAGS
ncbi:MAG: FHA domain-containing protein [Armatimonadota bacterium]